MKRRVTFYARVTEVNKDHVAVVGNHDGEIIRRVFDIADGFPDEDYKSEFKIGYLVKYDLVLTLERVDEGS